MTEEEQLLIPLENYLKAGLHIGTKFRTEYMAPFIYKIRPDGLAVLNIQKVNERIQLAAIFLSQYNPEDILVVCRRENGWEPVKLFSKLTASIIGAEDVKRICEIENILKNNTQLDFNLKDLIERELKIFKAQNIFYGKLLDIKRPKVIYLVNYIDYFALLNQARIKKIKTVELQHGLVIKESLIYHFPSVRKDSLQYFPTEYFYWKNFNYNTAKLPLSDGNIIPNEYNHLEYLKLRYKGVLKDEKSILIASQPFYSEKIQEFVLRNLPFMQDYTFYYKLHPMEFNAFETSKNAIKLSTFGNLKIIRNEESIYKLLMRCPYIVGIYSTALFEAEMFGCQPLILRTDGNYTSSLLKEGSGVLIDVDDDLRSCLSGSK